MSSRSAMNVLSMALGGRAAEGQVDCGLYMCFVGHQLLAKTSKATQTLFWVRPINGMLPEEDNPCCETLQEYAQP
jgi:hypothetical protein